MSDQLHMRAPEMRHLTSFARAFLVGVWLVAMIVLVTLAIDERPWAPELTVAVAMISIGVGLRLSGRTPASLLAEARSTSFSVAIGLLLVVALCSALVRLPPALSWGYDALTAPSKTLAAADVDPLNNDAQTPSLVAAARVIPPGVTYAVISAYGKPPWIFNMWLMPRVQTPYEPGVDSWLILYDTSAPQGLKVKKRVLLMPGVYALQLAS